MAHKSDLDRIDRAILVALQKNARLSNKELAARVGLAPSSAHERVRRLRETGVLTGFHAAVDPARLGVGLEAMIAVRLQQHSRGAFERFRGHLVRQPEVLQVYYVGGANDFLIHVGVRDTAQLRDFALDRLTSRPEVVHMETALVFEHVENRVSPDYVNEETD